MKKKFLFLVGLMLFGVWAWGQSAGRITFSSGGGSSKNALPCSLGEVFVGAGKTVTMGSQQNQQHISATHETVLPLNILLSPNPSSGVLQVSIPSKLVEKGSVFIIAVDGSTQLRQAFGQPDFEILLTNLIPGNYWLIVFNDQSKLLKTIPFIKI